MTRLTRFDSSADIGTALSQWDEVKNYSGGEDICLGNVVRDNKIITNVRRGCRSYIPTYSHTLVFPAIGVAVFG